ncbi:hypothetical protein PoB_006661500 [Plakobranchus ocellatus]|uniref:Uncharacterized protein n=1 Tax=Plakobranchus ocellatus TaxID=259542 RepID=A0AAV4D7Z8_9GAST|nr:hypothetical protein PoB_006661500 [Plakobranchus ocellatus]
MASSIHTSRWGWYTSLNFVQALVDTYGYEVPHLPQDDGCPQFEPAAVGQQLLVLAVDDGSGVTICLNLLRVKERVIVGKIQILCQCDDPFSP